MTDHHEERSGATDRHKQLSRLTYSVVEAAAVTGLGKTTLYALMRSGTLPSFTVGRRRLIASSDLEGMIRQARQAAA